MTREEFLEKAVQKYKVIDYKSDDSEHDFLLKNINKDCVVEDITKIEKFVDEFSRLGLFEKSTDKYDKVYKFTGIGKFKSEYWEDVKIWVIKVADMMNTSHKEINFFMSEKGNFYTEKHEKIADNTDDFLEYFLNVPCNYHEPPSEYTYQMLREAGWYEGRRIDISELIADCERDGVFLTDKQKEFISEFRNIHVGEVSIEVEKDNGCYEPHHFYGDFPADTVSVGYYKTVLRIYLSSDGRLFHFMGKPLGLDAMEAFHIMLNDW